jgi:hypothetical protein
VELSDGNSITANLPGGQVFQNAGGSVLGALQDLQDLYTALQTGNNITGTVTEIDNALKQVTDSECSTETRRTRSFRANLS